jgi:hypothetical protein
MTHLYQPAGTALNDDQMTRLREAFSRQRTTAEGLVARLKEERERQTDFVADTRSMRMVPVSEELAERLPEIPQSERLRPTKPKVAIVPVNDDELWYQATGPVAANAHAHNQIGSHLGIPRKYYLKMLEDQPDLLAANVNTWLDANPKRRMVRTMRTNGSGPVMSFARGWMSDSYRRLDALELCDAVMPLLTDPASGWEIHQCGITDLAMHIEAVYPSITADVAVGDQVALAVKLRTSEVAAGALSVAMGPMRLVCANIMWIPEYTERIVHLGSRQEGLVEVLTDRTIRMEDELVMAKMRDLVAAMANHEAFAKMVATLQRAATASLADPVAASELLGNNLGLGDGELHQVQREMMTAPGTDNMWGLANALTATAREMDFERKAELETAAGKLMTATGSWRQYTEAAA